MNKCDTCKNQKTQICMHCLIVGGEQTYWFYKSITECPVCGCRDGNHAQECTAYYTKGYGLR